MFSGQRWKSKVRALQAAMALACCVLATAALAAQTANSGCKPGSKDPACAKAGSDSSATDTDSNGKPLNQQFPFPVEQSRHGSDADSSLPALPKGADADPPASSDAPRKLPPLPSGADANPPESSERPLKLPPASGSSGSSSSSSSNTGTSSSRSADDDNDVAPTTPASDAPVKASALKDLGSRGSTSAARAKLEATRVEDDLKVARFYLQDGNTQGAYLRYKDAVDHDPQEPEARFGLAEAAARLNKHDEAVVNYREYLKLDAGGDHDKPSRKALQKLGAGVQ